MINIDPIFVQCLGISSSAEHQISIIINMPPPLESLSTFTAAHAHNRTTETQTNA